MTGSLEYECHQLRIHLRDVPLYSVALVHPD
jgi:hypothetical protein